MKKWSTLVFFVKKYNAQQKLSGDVSDRDFLTSAEDKTSFSPSERSIKNIMDFAASYEVLDSESAGQIELINN